MELNNIDSIIKVKNDWSTNTITKCTHNHFFLNLVFLSEYDKDLYHRVDELSRMIENGIYEEKYHLEFIMEDGDFDIWCCKWKISI